MDSNLTKVCPQCKSRAVCKCGYAFPSKRKAQSGNAMKRRRVHKASVKASETSQKKLCAGKRWIECVELAREPLRHPINRQETDKMRKRASETPQETMISKREIKCVKKY